MPIRRSYPVRFTPRGLVDAYDATDVFPGACRRLQNFILDDGNPELLVSRPGVGQAITTFSGFTNPSYVSATQVVGDIVYGMVSTQRTPGFDEPFVYDVATNTFSTVAGVTSSNVPASPPTTGEWTPPTIASVGTKILITHPGFNGSGNNFFGVIDLAPAELPAIQGSGSTSGGSLSAGTYYVQVTATDNNTSTRQVVYSVSAPITIGSTSAGSIAVVLPDEPYSFSVYMGTTITPDHYAATGAGDVSGVHGNQTITVTVTGSTATPPAVPVAPYWYSANLADFPLLAVPTSVANFNNRAWYAVSNTVNYSDVLDPLVASSAGQSVTLGDSTPVTAQVGLPIQTSSAGVIGGLIVFKAFQIWQITGDPVFNNLSDNYLSLNVGTQAPRSVVQTPTGIFFAAVDAPYYVDHLASVKLIADAQTGVPDLQIPYQYTTEPSRMAAGYSGGVYRICMPTIIQGNRQTNDYWLNLHKRRWTGPHTFPYDCIASYGEDFILANAEQGAALFRSQSIPQESSVYVDVNQPLTCVMESSTLPKEGHMAMKQVVESTIELSSSGSPTFYAVTAEDDQQNILNSVTITTENQQSFWEQFDWGAANWNSALNIPTVYTIPWTIPIVFQKLGIQLSVTGTSSVTMGTMYLRYQDAGFTNTLTNLR